MTLSSILGSLNRNLTPDNLTLHLILTLNNVFNYQQDLYSSYYIIFEDLIFLSQFIIEISILLNIGLNENNDIILDD